MTEQPGAPSVGELTDEQRAFLTAQTAAQAAVSPNPAADAAENMAQVVERGPTLPAEDAIEQLMAAFKAQSEQLEALRSQVGVMQKQADEATAASGGPPVIRYAQAALAHLEAMAVAHPDLGKGYFAPVIEQAQTLVEAATDLSKNGGSPAHVEQVAGSLERFLTKTHWRKGGKYIDFSMLADTVETVLEEAEKLAA